MPPQIVHLAGFGPMPAHVAKTFLAILARFSPIPAPPSQKVVRERLRDENPDFV